MTKDTHDNDNSTWTSIGLHAALIINRLRNQQQIDGTQEQCRQPDEKDSEHERREFPIVIDKKRSA